MVPCDTWKCLGQLGAAVVGVFVDLCQSAVPFFGQLVTNRHQWFAKKNASPFGFLDIRK
jgi:hypothetical protein